MQILFVLEIIGTIAFAVSGAVVGIQKKMDIFGVCILGLTAAVGGGILRDLILNITPPAAFQNPAFAVTAILVSILIFIPAVRNMFEHGRKIYETLILLMDSIGLGGGILRDIFAGNTPYIFIKHFYACASIIGAWTCALLWPHTGSVPAMIAGAAVTVVLRLLAARFRWSLPKAK